jgi:hypothetical protein
MIGLIGLTGLISLIGLISLTGPTGQNQLQRLTSKPDQHSISPAVAIYHETTLRPCRTAIEAPGTRLPG